MSRTWTKVGSEYTGKSGYKARVEVAISALAWKDIGAGHSEGMMPALGIKEAIKQLRLPRVSHHAISRDLAPYGLYGIRAHYKDGAAEVFVLDAGSELVVLASDFEPKAAATA